MPGGGARPDDTADDLHAPVDPHGPDDEAGRPVPPTSTPPTPPPTTTTPGAGYPDVPSVARDAEQRRGGGILLPLVLLVVVVLAAVVGWQLFRGGDEDPGVAAPTTSSSPSAAGPSSGAGDSPSEEEPSPSQSPSPTESETPEDIERASTSQRCASDAAGATAYRGNDVTTCEFAVETARVLVDTAPELPATITARSPVTEQDYDMACENTSPVVCRGGNDALVYVDLP